MGSGPISSAYLWRLHPPTPQDTQRQTVVQQWLEGALHLAVEYAASPRRMDGSVPNSLGHGITLGLWESPVARVRMSALPEVGKVNLWHHLLLENFKPGIRVF